MPDAETSYLRMYCLCGQKMKVSDSMYGLPGKCVACRQKIRIPRRDEVPEGVTAIYLKDHPELVRGRRRSAVGKSASAKGKVSSSARDVSGRAAPDRSVEAHEPDEIVLGEAAEPTKYLPLDGFEFLQKLCSIEYRVEKSLAAEGVTDPAVSLDEVPRKVRDLVADWQRIEEVRADLNEDLRQRLLETAIELASVQEKIGEGALDARVGKLPYPAYAERAAKLREQRERLERQQQNLRGWLRLRDPFLAGGYVDVPTAELETLQHGTTVPHAPEEPSSVLDAAIERLRSALQQRAAAERRLQETRAAREKGELSDRRARIARKEYDAQKALAEAAIAFYRRRLEHLRSEFRRDLETLEVQKEQLRQGEASKAVSPGYSETREKELLRARSDRAKAIDLIERTLTASTAHEVPRARGTFLVRLGSGSGSAIGWDAWAGWGAALLMLAGVFLPLAPRASLLGAYSNGGGAQWALLLVVATAVCAGLAAGIPLLRARAAALLALWTLSAVAGVWMLREVWYTPSLFAASVRDAGALWARPALLTFVAGSLVLLAAGSLAALRDRQLRWAPLAAVVVVLLAAAFIATNAAGMLEPAPALDIAAGSGEAAADGGVEHLLSIANAGGRPFFVLTAPAAEARGMRNAYMLELRQREGPAGWRNVTNLLDANFTRAAAAGPSGLLRARPGDRQILQFRAGAGDYRLVMQNLGTREERVQTFTVARRPLPSPLPPPPPAERLEQPEEETVPAEVREAPARPGVVPVEVELRGIMTVGDREPMFSFAVHFPDGESTQHNLTLGDVVYGAWVVREYNPQRQMAVLSDGPSLVTVSRGERVALR